VSDLWDKACEAAKDARLLFEAGRYDGACNRAYYAMFNAARACLATHGVDPKRAKRHATVQRLFSLQFVQEGQFDDEDGRALRRAGEYRNVADYDDVSVGHSRVEAVMASMERFMAAAQRVTEGFDA